MEKMKKALKYTGLALASLMVLVLVLGAYGFYQAKNNEKGFLASLLATKISVQNRFGKRRVDDEYIYKTATETESVTHLITELEKGNTSAYCDEIEELKNCFMGKILARQLPQLGPVGHVLMMMEAIKLAYKDRAPASKRSPESVIYLAESLLTIAHSIDSSPAHIETQISEQFGSMTPEQLKQVHGLSGEMVEKFKPKFIAQLEKIVGKLSEQTAALSAEDPIHERFSNLKTSLEDLKNQWSAHSANNQ